MCLFYCQFFESVPKKLKDLKIQDSNLCDNQSGDLIGHGTRSHCSTLQRNGLVGHFGAYSIELLVESYELCGRDCRRLQASCKKINQRGVYKLGGAVAECSNALLVIENKRKDPRFPQPGQT